MNAAWIADRVHRIEASGIRKAFELAKRLKDPINLSIGLPDFDVPADIQAAATRAMAEAHNAYTMTTGLPALRDEIQGLVDAELNQPDREVMVTSGTAGGLSLVLAATVDPGDEVIVFDPYFVMYNNLIAWSGGVPVVIDTYPDFQIPLDRVAQAITPRTKCIIVNSPNNPTGVVIADADLKALAELCRDREILLLSDEVYRSFSYDSPFVSPAKWNPDVVVVDGFSKAHGMTGWRLGFAHGPSLLMQELAKLQQFSFVCAPAPLQAAVVGALQRDLSTQTAAYRAKRDRVVAGLEGSYELARPEGAFYAFPKVPAKYRDATEFAAAAIDRNLIVIPGNTFSRRNTHFRISYAVNDATLERAITVLRELGG